MPIAFLISFAVVAADLIIKYCVRCHMAPGESISLLPGLRLTYVQNRGMAFGWLDDHRWVFLVLSALAILALIGFIAFRKGYMRTVYVGMALALGGGIGNMIDRLALGYVIDYIDFYPIPFWKWVFNLADAAICVGIAVLCVYLLFLEKKAKAAGKKVLFDEQSPKKDEQSPKKDEKTDGNADV